MIHRTLLFLISFTFLLYSCDDTTSKRTLPDSNGRSGELIIVVDTAYANNKTGRALEDVFLEELYGVPRSEPIFEVSTVPPKGFTSMLKMVRNILEMDIRSTNKSEIKIQNDVFANDQLIVTIAAKNDQEAAAILTKNKEKLQRLFNQEELKRTQKRLTRNVDKENQSSLLEKHGVTVAFPKEYFLSIDTADFFFLRKNKVVGEHQILQGLMVYHYPYTIDSNLMAVNIVDSMEHFIQHIKGKPKGFMQVERQYPLLSEEVSLHDNFAVELRGLWRMEGIFMGGSFFNYTTIHPNGDEVVGVYGFVYAPKFSHREYLRELRSLSSTIMFINE